MNTNGRPGKSAWRTLISFIEGKLMRFIVTRRTSKATKVAGVLRRRLYEANK